jgi:hypothetical protein
MSARALFAFAFLIGGAADAAAADFHFDAYADARLVLPPKTDSYMDGALGKLRYGDDDGTFHLSDVIGQARVQIVPELMASATARINTEYGPALDLLEAYVRYRPVSTNEWRWSVKAGAFFPPGSLENDQLGWSSFWTITPSVINSWVGYELRTIGTEGTLEWRREDGAIKLVGAVFGWNDPAGVLIADGGWNFDDHYTGLFEHSRIPDASAISQHRTPPVYANLFTEMDNSPGWYLDLSWTPTDIGGFNIMRYDNRADPTVIKDGQIAWHTTFWEAGFRKQLGKVTLLAQAMSGATLIQPSASYRQNTDFRSAYVLAGYDLDAWWLAARLEVFQTRTQATFPSALNEDGYALTLSASWMPKDWLRLTGELIAVDDTRQQRVVVDEAPHQIENQLQLLTRVYF